MFNQSETTVIIALILIALGIIFWGYNRAQAYGKLGILAWLQSVVLFAPWLIFFTLFAAGIYLNFAGILFLLIISILVYIFLGRRLRESGQDLVIQKRATEKLEEAAKEKPPATPESEDIEKLADNSQKLFIPEADIQAIKGIFGIDTFFATETIAYQEGLVFKGNLRGEPEEVYPKLAKKLEESLEGKYRLFLVENPQGKPIVILLPSSSDPRPTTLAQKNLAVVLLVATIVTILEVSSTILGFDLFSNLNRYQEALPITLGLLLILVLHELGHRIVAKKHQVRLSWPFFLPSWQIGAFGAITRFESLIPNRKILFDVSFAGPAFGGVASLGMLTIGLFLSNTNEGINIPTQFFQGSILVASLAKLILGSTISESVINIHPLALIGWLGLVITAINLLPAGQLDGGRIIQAIYGRKIAQRTTIATLILIGIVAITNSANPIPLYWGVLIFILQRQLERPSLNELTEVDDARAFWGLLALFLVLATLIPLSSGLASRLGMGS